jgi:hypothetical protein
VPWHVWVGFKQFAELLKGWIEIVLLSTFPLQTEQTLLVDFFIKHA